MTRTTVRALVCALIVITAISAVSAVGAAANPGDPPELVNNTTGWHSLWPPAQPNGDEAAAGDRLEGRSNDWANTGSYSYVYSWQRCLDTAANGCVTVPGATTTSYTLLGSDVGKTLRFCAQASTGTMCTNTTTKVVQAHTDTDGDGYNDYEDSCYKQTGVLPGGCPDYSQQPTVTNKTTGGDVDGEVAAGDELIGDPSTWAGHTGPYTYEWRACIDEWCQDGSWLIYATTDTWYTVQYNDYGYHIVFCAVDASGRRMCSKGAGGPFGVRASHTDTDKDGVADYKDKCPSVAALTADGCPPPPAPAPTPAPNSTQAAAPVLSDDQPPASNVTANAPAVPGPAPNGVGADRAAQVTAVINNHSRSLRIGYGKRATITGVLRDASGKPIARAELVVLAKRTAATAKFAKLTTVTTDAKGRYRYRAPAGPSRIVRIAYFAFANDAAVADSSDVTLRVAGALTLTAPKRVRNKHAVTFRGRLRGKPVPKGGVLVDLQVLFHGKWRTFATPRTNGRGAFGLKYRFTQGAAHWSFRARLRKDSLYPYEFGYSRQIAVAVTG